MGTPPCPAPSTPSTSQIRHSSFVGYRSFFKDSSRIKARHVNKGQVVWDGKLPQQVGQPTFTDITRKLQGNQTSNLGGNQAGGDGKDDKDKKVLFSTHQLSTELPDRDFQIILTTFTRRRRSRNMNPPLSQPPVLDVESARQLARMPRQSYPQSILRLDVS